MKLYLETPKCLHGLNTENSYELRCTIFFIFKRNGEVSFKLIITSPIRNFQQYLAEFFRLFGGKFPKKIEPRIKIKINKKFYSEVAPRFYQKMELLLGDYYFTQLHDRET